VLQGATTPFKVPSKLDKTEHIGPFTALDQQITVIALSFLKFATVNPLRKQYQNMPIPNKQTTAEIPRNHDSRISMLKINHSYSHDIEQEHRFTLLRKQDNTEQYEHPIHTGY